MRARERAYACVVSIVLVGAVLWPLSRHPEDDSFPLSTYPMFSRGRPSAMVTLPQVLAVGDDGAREPVDASDVFSSEVLTTMVAIDRAIAQGQPYLDEFCRGVADRLRASGDYESARSLEIVSSVFDAVAYFEGRTEPSSRHVFTRCEVAR